MLGVTIFGIFFTPVFYVVVRWLTDRGAAVQAGKAGAAVLVHDATVGPTASTPDGQESPTEPEHSAS
jgi:hypothetical protein